jgi:hypothetical protein
MIYRVLTHVSIDLSKDVRHQLYSTTNHQMICVSHGNDRFLDVFMCLFVGVVSLPKLWPEIPRLNGYKVINGYF